MSWLLLKPRDPKFVRFPIHVGIVPVKLLLYKWSSVRFVRFLISVGIVPVSWLIPKSRVVRLVRLIARFLLWWSFWR